MTFHFKNIKTNTNEIQINKIKNILIVTIIISILIKTSNFIN